MNHSDTIALGTLLFAILTNMIWLAAWYLSREKSSERKRVEAERDFNHLKNNQLQISDAIAELMDEFKEDLGTISRDILEIKIMLNIKAHHQDGETKGDRQTHSR
ncbi:hypothetical protein Cylst_2564 [Cylindrospermum stagnale PCC 7417]|uniref:Uncharacterized protein n=1 Tax=Cylindrospermum stagnale PCC 7417 TaxID=56107 RepID=K9WWK8_9NOST|nr:hypothetical protein [Cylindrospermum stagnale]AFZ24770.1 hypothetical protein Cylst_2564 [Cylindrospermum stagnale PCC 7417]